MMNQFIHCSFVHAFSLQQLKWQHMQKKISSWSIKISQLAIARRRNTYISNATFIYKIKKNRCKIKIVQTTKRKRATNMDKWWKRISIGVNNKKDSKHKKKKCAHTYICIKLNSRVLVLKKNPYIFYSISMR